MSCLRRRRRPKPANTSDEMEKQEETEERFLRRILKRVSVLSSILIRFLRDIRADILFLFGKRDTVDQSGTNADTYDGLSLLHSVDGDDDTLVNITAKTTNAGKTLPPGQEYSQCIPKKNAIHDMHRDGNTETEPCCNVTMIPDSTGPETAEKCPLTREQHEHDITEFLRAADPDWFTEEERRNVAKEITGYVKCCDKKAVITQEMQSEGIKIMKKYHDKAFLRKRIAVLKAQHDEIERNKLHTTPTRIPTKVRVDTEPLNKPSSVLHPDDSVGIPEVSTISDQTSPLNWKPNKAFEARLKHNRAQPVTSAMNECFTKTHVYEKPEARHATSNTYSATAGTASEVTHNYVKADVTENVPRSLPDHVEGKTAIPKPKHRLGIGAALRRRFASKPKKEFVIQEPKYSDEPPVQDPKVKVDINREHITADPSKTRAIEEPTPLSETGSTTDSAPTTVPRKDGEQTAQDSVADTAHDIGEPMEYLITNAKELSINKSRVTKMMHLVIKHCIAAFVHKRWKYRMLLTAKVHLTPTGKNDWRPVYCDFLYNPDFETGNPTGLDSRVAKFERLVSLEPYLDFIGTEPSAEQLLDALHSVIVKTTMTDIRRNQPNEPKALLAIGATDELFWCTELMDVMTYISYYVVIGCAKIMRNIFSKDTGLDERKILIEALGNHVVKKFSHSIKSMVPRMRHAIENFCLEDATGDGTPTSINTECQCMGPHNHTPGQQPVQGSIVSSPSDVTATLVAKPIRKRSRNTKHRRSGHQHADQIGSDLPPVETGGGDTDDTGQVDGSTNGDAQYDTKSDQTRGEGNQTITSGDVSTDDVIITMPPDLTQHDADDNDDVNATDCQQDALDHVNTILAADFRRDVEWDFGDYITYIETNNTLDYSAMEVIVGHGETPNKKKLCGEIREKVKTKGIANKHLEPQILNHETNEYQNETIEEYETGFDVPDEDIAEELDTQAETPAEPEVEAPVQVLDDREYNLVPEEVLRKDESKLKDLEEVYNMGSAEKKDKYRKRKEKKPKGVRLQLDFDFPDSKRRH